MLKNLEKALERLLRDAQFLRKRLEAFLADAAIVVVDISSCDDATSTD